MTIAGPGRVESDRKSFTDALLFGANILFILWIAFWTFLIVLTVLPAILCIHRSWRPGRAPIANRRFIQVYGQLTVRLSWPMIRVSVLNRPAIKAIEPCVYVLNHFSPVDVFFCGFVPTYKTVLAIRAWPFRLPLFNIFMRAAEYMNVEEISGFEILKAASTLIGSGIGVLFFPEGHRSRNGQLWPLRKGAFRIAAENHVPIIPVTIQGTEYLGGYKSRLFRPCRVNMRFHPPLVADGCDAAAIKDLRDRVTALFQKEVYDIRSDAKPGPSLARTTADPAIGAEGYGCRASALGGTDDDQESDPGCGLKRLPAEDATRFEVKNLIPHSGDMNLIEGSAWRDHKKIILSMTVPADNIFVAPDGTIAPLALIEMLAQLCAAEHSYKLRLGPDQRINGFLGSIDHVRFRTPVRAGDRIDMVIWQVLELGEIHRVRGEIYRGTALAGQAELTLFEASAGNPKWEAPVPPSKPLRAVLDENRNPWAEEKDRVGREILRNLRRLDIRPRESAEATFAFPPDFIGFSGHFPGRPLVPGVIIIYLGWVLAEMCLPARLEVRFIKKAKFTKPIRPWDKVDVIVRRLKSDETSAVWFSADVLNQGNPIAKVEIGLAQT
jgi:1-acyl-sn-glycerol-3-phosphate acyltransferase